jgi:hypothetical protein
MAEIFPLAAKSPISAPRILLEGPGGTGKTYALHSLVAAGITPCIIALDIIGLESVADIPCPKLHWKGIKQTERNWNTMLESAKAQAPMDYEQLTKQRDFNKANQQKRWISVLESLARFKCDRCGADLGMVDSWPTSKALVIDHLTELGQAAREWHVGEKLAMHQGEWGAIMTLVESFIRQLTTVPRCMVIMIAHTEREVDEVAGGTKVMTATLGRKLAPKLPPFFSDVVLAQRLGKEFWWSTAAGDVDLKTRNLPIELKLLPDFGQIVAKWRSRGGILE